jgi:TolB-like protein/DNA-binding winged helix-turn-helix (wHTH) protein/Tfp pilus assembly protein PilF
VAGRPIELAYPGRFEVLKRSEIFGIPLSANGLHDVSEPRPRWRFGTAVLDERASTLEVGGAAVALDRSGYGLLVHLVRHSGQVVGKDELLRAGWPGRVVSENSLAKAIGRLRVALEDPDGEIIRVVHGYGYKLVAEVASEAAPAVAASPPAVVVRPTRRIAALLAVGTALALAAIAVPRVAPQAPANVAAVPSIAVLPFVDLSANHDQQHFSDGLAEELLDSLAKLPQLRVVARTSSFAYRGRAVDVQTIGRELGATTVLEGSVRESAGRLRVTAQLLDATNGYHIWSETYDRPRTDLFAMQDEIARAIVAALRIELLPGQLRGLAEHGTSNPEAYTQFLIARHVYKDDETGGRRSLAAYERAVALDPDFIDAWLGLADLLGHSGMYADTAEEALAGKKRAREVVERIVALAPNRPDGYLLRGDHRYAHWWDWAGGEADLEKAGALGARQTQSYLVRLARLRAAFGRLDESTALLRRASELDLASTTPLTVMGYHLIGQRRFDEAAEILQHAARDSPLDEHAHYYLGLVELLQGRPAQALAHFEDSAHVLRLTGLAAAHHALGRNADSDRDLALLIERYGHILPYQAAEISAWRGEPDLAFHWLDRTLELHDASVMYLEFDPLIDSLRADPRFAAVLEKVGLPR